MKTEVAILHHDYPASVREYVEQKLEGLTKYYDRIVSVRALLEQQHDEHRTEMIANVGQGVVLVVDARAGSIRAAADDALERMGRSLARHKDKLTKRSRRQARAQA